MAESETPCIRQFQTKFDALSPPYFSPNNGSMGAYKDDSKIDLAYSKAIVEIREIDKIGEFSLSKMGLPEELHQDFLIQPLSRVTTGEILSEIPLHESVEKLFVLIEEILSTSSLPKAAESVSTAP